MDLLITLIWYQSGNTIADNDVKTTNVKCNSTVFGVSGTCTIDDMKIGDLVSYTPPTGTTDNIPTSWTGYASAQTIHPEYNKLWRVIKKNVDGTVDMISEYTSYEKIYFKGKEGYRMLVKGLNNIANLYMNNNYIQNAREAGYNNQTEILSTTATVITAEIGSTRPFGNTVGNNNEAEGGGDIMYQYDTGQALTGTDYGSNNGIIYHAYKKYSVPLYAYRTNQDGSSSNSSSDYWLASRIIDAGPEGWHLNGRGVATFGGIGYIALWNSSTGDREANYAIRPVLTVKSGLTLTGNGIDIPWKIN